MTRDQLVAEAQTILEQLQDLIDENMPYKGLTSNECQKRLIMLALIEVEHTLNGLENDDLIEDKYE